jgi:glycosyltransferase involved in cell wall biosynthesis
MSTERCGPAVTTIIPGEKRPLFSIITPSFNPSPWLRLCIASVADQRVDVEHIVQDAGSTDGTLDWLRADARVKTFVEPDSGMYDAVNRGLRRAQGDILAYLNCDEQYLPGCLQRVDAFFRDHPAVDVLFGDVIFVNADLEYLLHRKVQVPLRLHTWVSHLSTLTCATFFRRIILDKYGLFFDSRLRDVGDAEWVIRLLQHGIRMAVLRQFTSVFMVTGQNMSAKPNAVRETQALHASAPFVARTLKPLLIVHHRVRRLAGGIYFQRPFSYSVYTQSSPDRRVLYEVTRPRGHWRPDERRGD